MDKKESQIMKGVAILFMLFLHLFNQMQNVDLCHTFLSIDGKPLVYILTGATNPVSFFLILGGFGLYKVWAKGDKNRWLRILKIYIQWWIIMSTFVLIGHFIKPSVYPGSILEFIGNAIGFSYSYNGEMWFLFPYVVLSVFSPIIFKLLKKIKSYQIILFILATLLIHIITSFCISRYGSRYLYPNPAIYQILLPFHLLFAFSLGAAAARTSWFERVKILQTKFLNTKLSLLILVALVIINCIFKYNFFYSFLFITFLSIIHLPKPIAFTLVRLGNNSMNMWMIHSWLCYYLFKEFIYSFSYPFLIFFVLVMLSYILSLLINLIAYPIESIFMSKRKIEEKPIL